MSEARPEQEATHGARAAALPCALAWLLPGAGHFYLGRRKRGVAFLTIVLLTFWLGLALKGRAYLADPEHPLTYLATFANVGLGPLDLLQREATYDRLVWRLPRRTDRPLPRPPTLEGEVLLKAMRQRINAPTNEYGTTFLLTAGLMNLLLILDAFDIATGRKLDPAEESA
jgi:TM2 domain-containing membrane protein YozV